MKTFTTYKVIYGMVTVAFVSGGCSEQGAKKDSVGSAGKFDRLALVQKMKPKTQVTAHGTMVEKCPLAGCWFVLRDQTGTIKVDLKATKQTVINTPLNSTVTVSGTVAPDGTRKMIRAVSATF